MPRKTADLDKDFDFKIWTDPSCLRAPMEEDTVQFVEMEVDGGETRAVPKDIPLEGRIPKDGGGCGDESYDGLEVEEEGPTTDTSQEEAEHDEAEQHDDTVEEPDTPGTALERDIDDLLEQMHDSADDEELQPSEEKLQAREADIGDETEVVDFAHEEGTRADGDIVDIHEDVEAEELKQDAHTQDLESTILQDDAPSQPHEDALVEAEQDTLSALNPRSPTHPSSNRQTSLRTEALIQAAARAVVAKIEERAVAAVHSRRNSQISNNTNTYEQDLSMLARAASPELSRVHLSPTRQHRSRPNSPFSRGSEEEGESSSASHHDPDSDVFSDHSARSSLGSFEHPVDDEKDQETGIYTPGRSPRMSDIFCLSQYHDQQTFVTSPKSSKPRIPFRTPSSVRALQLSSPTPSVFNGASPRSTKRSAVTVSRLGSPRQQYSPKSRATPPRLKSWDKAPLVLLHVTLLPLRWMWGGVIARLDAALKDGFESTEELVSLRDNWRQLGDRVGDTVLERGVLLPHPQNDYEVLEERLLEVLELPLRRRGRVLECGHYLCAANEEEMRDEDEEEGVDGSRERRHWCATCRGEIRFEDLGAARVFRIKVYASNGLMKAGAWEACWKEMERVDVEVEPIVENGVLRELERLGQWQGEEEEEDEILPDIRVEEGDYDHLSSAPMMHTSPPSAGQMLSSPVPFDNSEARRLRDEERMREIYGTDAEREGPEPIHNEPTLSPEREPTPEPYTPPEEETYTHPTPEWTQDTPPEAHHAHHGTTSESPYQSASLPELMLESVKVLLRDRKNAVILILSLFALFLAVRPKDAGVPAYHIEVGEQGYRLEKVQEPVGFVKGAEEISVEKTATEVQIWPTAAMTSQGVVEDVDVATRSEVVGDAIAPTGIEAALEAEETLWPPAAVPTAAELDTEEEENEVYSEVEHSSSSIPETDPETLSTTDVATSSTETTSEPTTSAVPDTIETETTQPSTTTSTKPGSITLNTATSPNNPCETLLSNNPTSPAETTLMEKRVVRVFETVTETETVRVSVTTSVLVDATPTPIEIGFVLGGPYRLPDVEI